MLSISQLGGQFYGGTLATSSTNNLGLVSPPLVTHPLTPASSFEERTSESRWSALVFSDPLMLFRSLPSRFILHPSDMSLVIETSVVSDAKASQEDVVALLQRLKSGNPRVRAMAADKLGNIKSPESVPPLIEALKGNNHQARLAAASALILIQDTRCIEPVFEYLKNFGRGLQPFDFSDIARGLLRMNDPRIGERVVQALQQRDKKQNRLIAYLLLTMVCESYPKASELLFAAFRTGRASLRHAIADTFQNYFSEAGLRMNDIEQLLLVMRDRTSRVRSFAVQVLGQTKDPRAVESLVHSLRNDPDCDVRTAAATALGEINDTRAREDLIQALRDPEWKIQRSAGRALGKMKGARTVDALVEALNDDKVTERREVLESLGESGDPRVLPLLIKMVRERNAFRQSAIRALGYLKNLEATEILIESLKDVDVSVRQEAAWSLGQLKDPRSFEALMEAVKIRDYRDYYVREWSLHALAQLKDRRAVEVLIEAARTYGDHQIAVIEALGEIGDPRAIETLILLSQGGIFTLPEVPDKARLALEKIFA